MFNLAVSPWSLVSITSAPLYYITVNSGIPSSSPSLSSRRARDVLWFIKTSCKTFRPGCTAAPTAVKLVDFATSNPRNPLDISSP